MLKQHSPAISFKIRVKPWNNWQAQWRVSTAWSAWNYFQQTLKSEKPRLEIHAYLLKSGKWKR